MDPVSLLPLLILTRVQVSGDVTAPCALCPLGNLDAC
jgi:hypothetical protein